MMDVTFDQLAALPFLRSYENAFRKATGVSLRLLPPDEKLRRANLRQSENPFCAFVSSTPAGCEACLDTQRRIAQSSASELVAQQAHCFAGLTDIAIPVVVAGRHVATLLSGQIFRRKPTDRDFEAMLKKIGAGDDKEWVKKAKKAFFETPVISPESLQAVIELLNGFARHLADDLSRYYVASGPETEPVPVRIAKKFVTTYSDEPFTLEQVLKLTHVSRFHFCKIFKKTTGITFTEYVIRVRVDKAKALLRDPSLRVSEIVFKAGFGSIPQFNSVFKRIVGLPPTEYRARLRADLKAPDARKLPAEPSHGIGGTNAEETEVPDNVIRASAFHSVGTSAALPPNIIRPALHRHARRSARA